MRDHKDLCEILAPCSALIKTSTTPPIKETVQPELRVRISNLAQINKKG